MLCNLTEKDMVKRFFYVKWRRKYERVMDVDGWADRLRGRALLHCIGIDDAFSQLVNIVQR